jgi:hypothetical protein
MPELSRKRLAKSPLPLQRRHCPIGSVLPEYGARRISRDDVQQDEGRNRDPDRHKDGGQ